MNTEMTLVKTTEAEKNPYYWIEQRVYKLAAGGYAVAMATKSGIDPNTFIHISETDAKKIIESK